MLALSLPAALLPLRTPCDFLFKAGHDVSVGDGNCGQQAFWDVQVRCVGGGSVYFLGLVTDPVLLSPSSPLAGSGVLQGLELGASLPRGHEH